MDAQFKNHLMGLLHSPGHRHESMTDASACSACGERFQKGLALYNRTRREKPELFGVERKYKPSYESNPEVAKNYDMLAERLKRDKLYKEHLRLSAFGTPEEKEREAARADSGFYTRHSDYRGVKFL